MFDIPAQYHKDELAKKELLLAISTNVVVSTSTIVTAIQNSETAIVTAIQNSEVAMTNAIGNQTDVLKNGSQVTQVVVTQNPAFLVVSDTAVIANGSIAAGALSIEIITSSDFIGTINGVSIPQLAIKTYPYIPGYIYPTINYTISAGTLYIRTLQS